MPAGVLALHPDNLHVKSVLESAESSTSFYVKTPFSLFQDSAKGEY